MSQTEPRWSETTAILGGSFDPPHLGHRQLVEDLFERFRFKKILIVPAGTPPLKNTSTSWPHRYEMSRLNFDYSGPLKEMVSLDPREEHKNPSYSYNTLAEINRERGETTFIIGSDQILELPRWHRFPEILPLTHWVVFKRKGVSEDSITKMIQSWKNSGLLDSEIRPDLWSLPSPHSPRFLTLVETRAPMISSTEIREKISRKTEFHDLKPEVLDYLKTHHLYGI